MAKITRKSQKSQKAQEVNVNPQDCNVILRDVEVQFWASKKFTSNPRYPEKFALTVAITDAHMAALERAIEAAIEVYKSESGDEDVRAEDFKVSFYESPDGTTTYTFRSDNDFREITALEGETLEDTDSLRVGKGSIVNMAIRANAINISRGNYYCVLYANAINIKHYVEYVGGRHNLMQSLLD